MKVRFSLLFLALLVAGVPVNAAVTGSDTVVVTASPISGNKPGAETTLRRQMTRKLHHALQAELRAARRTVTQSLSAVHSETAEEADQLVVRAH